MPYGGTDNARVTNLAGNDEVVTNSRMRASLAPVTVGTVTFPTNFYGTNWFGPTGTPISTTPGATSTLDAGQLLTGFIIQAPSAANTSTLDTAANIVKGVNAVSSGAQVGDYIPCYLQNGSANVITIAAGSGGSFDTNIPAGNKTVPINSSRYIFIRLTNVTAGSEAYTVYI